MLNGVRPVLSSIGVAEANWSCTVDRTVHDEDVELDIVYNQSVFSESTRIGRGSHSGQVILNQELDVFR